MALWGYDLWQWLAMVQHELLLFAGIFFLIGAMDDIAIDMSWLWLKLTGRARTRQIDRATMRSRPLGGPAALFIPAWQEEHVIADTLAHALASWPQDKLRVYVGCYRNDPGTINAATIASRSDPRCRIVILDHDGPTTKADCLNGVYQAMSDDEASLGVRFEMIVFHDAEDLVDPAGLALLDEAIAGGADFVQLPVEPLPQPESRWLGSHYCEEFVESHGKGMVVRDAFGAALPAAGVGCAASRQGIDGLARRQGNMLPFSADSLTEDYELGIGIVAAGGTGRFIRARGEDDRLIATRAYFPSRLNDVVRQKTRWVHGIALQGWDRIGWGGNLVEIWMRARDRRGPMTALILLLGYLLLVSVAFSWAAVGLGYGQPIVVSPLLKWLLIANFVFFIWRAMFRFAFTAREYDAWEGLRAILRIPVTNIVSIMAGRRALTAYIRTLFGTAITWDKTEHTDHPARLLAASSESAR